MGKISLTKDYNAPIEKVWEALTTPELIRQFWAPPGMETSEAKIDKLEPGGEFIYAMKSNDGKEMWVRCIYEDVEQPNKLSFMETPADKTGNPVPPSAMGMPGDEIVESYTELLLEEKNGVATVTMNIDYGDDKANEYASFGWKGMLENLAQIVE